MKYLLTALVLTLASCGSIKQQQNISEIMKNHVINSPVSETYEAAKAEFSGMYTPLDDQGKFVGHSKWISKPTSLGDKNYAEKDRFVVSVSSKGKTKSVVTVYRELMSNFSGSWTEKPKSRMYVYEFNIQKRLNPAIAKEIEIKASQMQ